MGLRLVVVSACVAAAQLLSAASANADFGSDRSADATPTRDGATVRVGDLGGPAAPVQSTGGTVVCKYVELGEDLNAHGYSPEAFNLPYVTTLTENFWYATECTVNGQPRPSRVFLHQPGGEAPISAEYLAQEAASSLTVAFPQPDMAPPPDADHLVGIAEWMWIDPSGFEPVSASASIPGISVTATAAPTSATWDMGDGSEPITCDAGTAYDPALHDSYVPTCSHVYQWDGHYTITVTTHWAITWSASNGDGGTLPGLDRSTTFDIEVLQRQAVIVEP